MPFVRLVTVLTLVAGLGCSSHRASSPAPAPATGAEVAIENQSVNNMDILVRTRDGAFPLGFAPSHATTRFAISPAMIAGAGIVRFEARPQRDGERVTSDAFTVRPGDQISWSIPPQ